MPTIVHFEIPVEDVQRARKFYEDLFGWKIERMPGPVDYWGIKTATAKGEPGVGGGMMKRQNPQHTPTNYIDVPSIDEYTAKVESLGGKVCMPKTAVPKMGYFAVCLDPENNVLGLWQCDENAA